MLIVTDSQWNSTLLHFYLMAADFAGSRLQMRYVLLLVMNTTAYFLVSDFFLIFVAIVRNGGWG